MNWMLSCAIGFAVGGSLVSFLWYRVSRTAFMGGYAAGYEHAKREDFALRGRAGSQHAAGRLPN